MEIAIAVSILFTAAIIFMVVSIPLLIISRTSRALKKSFAKLFPRRSPKKA
jgi:hypothetical protein